MTRRGGGTPREGTGFVTVDDEPPSADISWAFLPASKGERVPFAASNLSDRGAASALAVGDVVEFEVSCACVLAHAGPQSHRHVHV